MSHDIKAKPRPKTVAEWREARRKRYGNAGGNGGFRVLPSKVLDSDAFNELSKSSKLVLIMSLSQVDYWVKKHHNQVPRRESSIGPLRNDGCFSVPSNFLKERGIKSSETIAEARRELVTAGFWDTVETGSLYSTGVFRWSDRWLTYNQRSLADRKRMDPTAQAPGYCHYPYITRYNDQIKVQKGLALVYSSEQQEQECIFQDQDYVQLDLFSELSA
jgi:hypothetical protein